MRPSNISLTDVWTTHVGAALNSNFQTINSRRNNVHTLLDAVPSKILLTAPAGGRYQTHSILEVTQYL